MQGNGKKMGRERIVMAAMTPRNWLALGLIGALAAGVLAVYINSKPDPSVRADTSPEEISSIDSTCSGVDVKVGMAIPKLVNSKQPGTTFCIFKGIHRIKAPLIPKDKQKFIGVPGAVISGAKVLSNPVKLGTHWVYRDQKQQSEPWGPPDFGACRDVRGRPPVGQACKYNESVFLDGKSLWQVLSIDQLGPGTFYFDYNADVIHIADDPAGRTVEATANVSHAFSGSASDVEIRGLRIEKFPNRMQSAALDAGAGSRWIIENNEVRLNHGIGIWASNGSIVRRNHVHHQGQMGLAGQGADVIVERNEIDHNGAHGANWAWEGGGAKWVRTTGLIVRQNRSHDNYGPGLWTDGYNIHTLYAGNAVKNNSVQGIIHEISYDAVIRNNVVRGNGLEHEAVGSYWGGGIEVWQSSNVEIHNNLVENNAHGIMVMMTPRGSGPHGLNETANVFVHDNTIRLTNPTGRTGLAVYGGSGLEYYTLKNNRFESNHYYLPAPETGLHFLWMSDYITADEWRAYGNDSTGAFMEAASGSKG